MGHHLLSFDRGRIADLLWQSLVDQTTQIALIMQFMRLHSANARQLETPSTVKPAFPPRPEGRGAVENRVLLFLRARST